MASNGKFWMYDVTQLFRSFDLLPSPEDDLSTKLNTITRLALIACIVIAAYKPFLAFSTLIIVMVITMSVYSGSIPDPVIEGFEYGSIVSRTHQEECGNQQLYEFMREYNSTKYPDLNKVGFPITQNRFCNDSVPLEYSTTHISPNQQLVGGPNPKTRIPPLVVAPSHDLDSWRTNDFAVHSQINRLTNFDSDKSGYNYGILQTKCEECMYVPCQCKTSLPMRQITQTQQDNFKLPEVTIMRDGDLIEGFNSEFQDSHYGNRMDSLKPRGNTESYKRRQLIEDLILDVGGQDEKHKPFIKKYVKDVFSNRRMGDVKDFEIDETIEKISLRNNSDDPSVCFESPRRDNIITQTLQPGVFQKSHIGEPIQSNIGISYTQEWGPTEIQETDNMIKYTMYDPKNVITTPRIKEDLVVQDNTNVYDPRFTGYGTSYRSYVDQLTGRPKFFYDDVDAITMPNYITRSNVDVFPWANTYGSDKMMNTDEYRQLANNAFTESTLTFRTDLQERLMRKRNAELWQRRVAPISTMGRLGSSMKSCL